MADEIELTAQDLRMVTRYAAESAEEALPIFEEHHPGDRRPREAVEAAWTFVAGAQRTTLQRTSALAASSGCRAPPLPRGPVERKPRDPADERLGSSLRSG